MSTTATRIAAVSSPVPFEVIEFDLRIDGAGGRVVPMSIEVYGDYEGRGPIFKGQNPPFNVSKLICGGADVTKWLDEDDFATAFYDKLYAR